MHCLVKIIGFCIAHCTIVNYLIQTHLFALTLFAYLNPAAIFFRSHKLVLRQQIILNHYSLRGFHFISTGNLGNLLLIMILAVCEESNSQFGDSITCTSNGEACASLSMAVMFKVLILLL